MPLPFNKRNPDLAAKIDQAYSNAEVSSKKVGEATVGAALTETKSNLAVEDGLGNLLPDVGNRFKGWFDTARLIYDDVPSPADFAKAGVNFEKLEKEYLWQLDNGYEPQLVVAPMLKVRNWYNFFMVPQPGAISVSKLEASASVHDKQDEIMEQTVNLYNRHEMPYVPASESTGTPAWTAHIVSGSLKSKDFKGQGYGGIFIDYYPAVHEYLALQLLMMKGGRTPVDSGSAPEGSSSWLYGSYGDYNSGADTAICGYYSNDIGSVVLLEVNCRTQMPRMGARRLGYGASRLRS